MMEENNEELLETSEPVIEETTETDPVELPEPTTETTPSEEPLPYDFRVVAPKWLSKIIIELMNQESLYNGQRSQLYHLNGGHSVTIHTQRNGTGLASFVVNNAGVFTTIKVEIKTDLPPANHGIILGCYVDLIAPDNGTIASIREVLEVNDCLNHK